MRLKEMKQRIKGNGMDILNYVTRNLTINVMAMNVCRRHTFGDGIYVIKRLKRNYDNYLKKQFLR